MARSAEGGAVLQPLAVLAGGACWRPRSIRARWALYMYGVSVRIVRTSFHSKHGRTLMVGSAIRKFTAAIEA